MGCTEILKGANNKLSYKAAVITVSDRGYIGEREDTSGPALCQMLKENGYEVVYTTIIPDKIEMIETELKECSDVKEIPLILTTGGTGFSPKDVTPEATLHVIERCAVGIAEGMRSESFKVTPKACLSRGEAGIRKKSLIINLPGSKKAATENLSFVIPCLEHGIEMMLSKGSANCGEENTPVKKASPSIDKWLKEAKLDASAENVGMYLTHNGVVRKTAKAKVRFDDDSAKPVKSLLFSYDKAKVDEVIKETYSLPGVFYIRVWLNEGHLNIGDDIMYVLIGGDIRPRTIDALQFLVGKIKNECVTETEIY